MKLPISLSLAQRKTLFVFDELSFEISQTTKLTSRGGFLLIIQNSKRESLISSSKVSSRMKRFISVLSSVREQK